MWDLFKATGQEITCIVEEEKETQDLGLQQPFLGHQEVKQSGRLGKSCSVGRKLSMSQTPGEEHFQGIPGSS